MLINNESIKASITSNHTCYIMLNIHHTEYFLSGMDDSYMTRIVDGFDDMDRDWASNSLAYFLSQYAFYEAYSYRDDITSWRLEVKDEEKKKWKKYLQKHW